MPSTIDLSHTTSPMSDHSDLELDPLVELKDITASPTPLGEMLQNPGILRSLVGRKSSRRGSVSSQHSGDRERKSERGRDTRKAKKDSDTASILTLVLAEEERQAHQLKAVLRTTGDRLEAEIRRGDQAEERARLAESRARDASARATVAEQARHQAELESTRAREETMRFRMLYEAAEREIRKLEAELQKQDRQRREAEEAAEDAKDSGRKAQQTLREWQAREEGRLEGMRIEVRRRYEDGREDGFEDGRAEGYESGRAEGYEEGKAEGLHAGRTEGLAAGRLRGFDEGREVGHNDGFKEGYERGRKEERASALVAFDRFMADKEMDREIDEQSDTTSDEPNRVHRWVEDIRHVPPPPELHVPCPPSPKYVRPPSPSMRSSREASPLPIPPWLHRQPRPPTPAGLMNNVQRADSDSS
ncbi:hypothetical protein BDY19DRAFT_1053815 [Irpex rosettiformis]|uniref:Uncharacterized protein n=1 Tax=Irpex rosettiformis TaxID=378272 RepID=A0ACB8UGE3_9APHY|nr:hypothetical protein BDY19DRAFT_1053815 [Irpex rosettiformis]